MMKILSPIGESKDINVLDPSVYGTEFFFGYLPDWWRKKYNNKVSTESGDILSTPLNNRNDIGANVRSADDFTKIIETGREKGAKLYLTLNAKYYPEYVYEDLQRYVQEVYEMGIRHVICCDLGMIKELELSFPDIKVSVSCLNQVTNSKAVEFYSHYKNIEKIVFPRHMSSAEIKKIAENYPEYEFEYFIFSNKCMFDDGYCRGLHAFTPICKEHFRNIYYNRHTNQRLTEQNEEDEKFWSWAQNEEDAVQKGYCTPNFACTACSLRELLKIRNITTVKLSIRGHSLEERLRQVRMARMAIDCGKNDDLAGIQKAVCMMYGKEDLCRRGMACMMK